jgi:hypothetical protein
MQREIHMLNTTPMDDDIDQSCCGAIAATREHLRQHGTNLCHLLEALEESVGSDAFSSLHEVLSGPFPDCGPIKATLLDIQQVLAKQPASTLDRLARERNFYAAEAVRWNCERLSDLISRFPQAD